MTMRLRVLLPTGVLADTAAARISAEGQHGSFTLLPRHVDVVVALTTGILSWEASGEETFAAVDGGLLVKRGPEVTVGTHRAVVGPQLGELSRTIAEKFRVCDEHARAAGHAIARLEVDFIKRFLELEQRGHG